MPLGRRRFLEIGAASAVGASACTPAPLVCRAGSDVTPRWSGKIEHFIVLMLENRSYDHMLGSLRGPEHDGVEDGAPLAYEDADGAKRTVPLRYGAPPDRFSPDPGHGFRAVADQIGGTKEGERADMGGFITRFVRDYPSVTPNHIQRYATMYGDGHLPILQGLAKEYGVCTHWFSSLPSSTTPNRMFTHAGTSRGATRQGMYYSRVEGKMIFDALDSKDWGVYFHDAPHLWLTGDAWTKVCAGQFHYVPKFARDVRNDALPTYSFIEPRHLLPPWNSQHPTAGVSHGEKLIASVYAALAANPCVFEKSLLLITYDEHGGFYDHVVPPGHLGWNDRHPAIHHDVVAPDDLPADESGPDSGYGFTSLGPRVPAVVVSPWIERGSVFGWKARDPERRATFDHTSILATVAAMTGRSVASARARAATTLELTLNRTSPRRDYPPSIAFDPSVYSRSGLLDDLSPKSPEPEKLDGVAADLSSAFEEAHGRTASPLELANRFEELVGARRRAG